MAQFGNTAESLHFGAIANSMRSMRWKSADFTTAGVGENHKNMVI